MCLLLATCFVNLNAASTDSTLVVSPKDGGFALSVAGKIPPLYVSADDYPGVIRALKDLQTDIGKVTNVPPELFTMAVPKSKLAVIAGTLGKSALIDKLIKEGKLNISGIAGKVGGLSDTGGGTNQTRGIKKALVIAGSDKRGTIYGIYELSAKIGVSPWYWWADVPVEHKDALYVNIAGAYKLGPPSVKYRGIFSK